MKKSEPIKKIKPSVGQMCNSIFRLIKDHENTIIRLARKDADGLFHQPKSNGEYGYYLMRDLSLFVEKLSKIKPKRVLDIGCGIATLIRTASYIMPETKFDGIECEQKLVELSKSSWPWFFMELLDTPKSEHPFPSPILKDFFKTTKGFISKYDTLYFYEPIFYTDLARKFVNHLNKVTTPGQYILYVRAGAIGDLMLQSNLYEFVEGSTCKESIQLLKRI